MEDFLIFGLLMPLLHLNSRKEMLEKRIQNLVRRLKWSVLQKYSSAKRR